MKSAAIFIIRTLILALIIGVICSCIVFSFKKSVSYTKLYLNKYVIDEYPDSIYMLPLIAGLITGLLIYRFCPEASGEGLPYYINSVTRYKGDFTKNVGIYKYAAGLITMGFYGSGGFVGPMGLVNGHAGSFIIKKLRKYTGNLLGLPKDNYRLGAICGVAAALSAILKAPVGAAIFAAEVTHKSKLEYHELFPALISSAVSYTVYCKLTDNLSFFHPFYNFDFTIDFSIFWKLIFVSIITSLIGFLFITLYWKTSNFLKNFKKFNYLVPALGGLLTGIVAMFITKDTLGLGRTFLETRVFTLNNETIGYIAVFLILGKILTTTFTIGSGGSAGFTFPAVYLGVTSGHVISILFNASSSGEHLAFIATGMSCMLAVVLNISLAATVVVTEIFGIHYAVPAIIGSIIGYIIGRQKVLYEYSEEDSDENDV